MISKKNDAIHKINILLADLVDVSTHTSARQKLLEIVAEATGYDYAFLVELESDGVTMQVSSVYAPEKINNIIEKISGISPVGYRYKIDLDEVLQNPDISVFTHISDFFPTIPHQIGSLIGTSIGLKNIASIRQRTKDAYLGAVNFVAVSDDTDFELLEYLCQNHLVYALRLMHEQEDRAKQAKEYQKSLEKRIEERTIELEQALLISIAAEERISEHYLNMQQAREEAETRAQEMDKMLEGMRTLASAGSVDEIFNSILHILQDVLSFEDAFILIDNEKGELESWAGTLPIFDNMVWKIGDFFRKVLAGNTLAVFDISMIPEWESKEVLIESGICSALHIPIITNHSTAMLIGIHHQKGFFSKKHVRLAERFAALAVQALQSAELYALLDEKKKTLELTVAERTAELLNVNEKLLAENAERRSAEEIARKNEIRYRSLFERTNDAVFFVSLDGICLNANQQAADMLGYGLDELIGIQVEEIVVSSEHDDVRSKIETLQSGQTYPVYQRTYKKKDGTTLRTEMSTALALNEYGNPAHIQYIVRDISERERNAAEIRALAKFPEENPSAVLRVSSTGEILYANPASKVFLDTWECTTGDQLPKEIFAICLDENGQARRAQAELEIDTSVYLFSFAPVEDTNYINIYGRNITAEKESDRLKAEFIAGVSHELRTPLAPILGWSEILLDEGPGKLSREQREFIQTIYDSGAHLHRLVDDLLDITSLEANKFKIRKERISIISPIQKALSIVQDSAQEKRIKLDINLGDNLPDIHADLNRIGQVLVNLLSNAIKFTPVEGSVSLQAAYKPAERMLSIRIEDTGIGIADKNLAKLFSRFFRSEDVVKASIPGTGLGLFITKEIIDAHDGAIYVESEEGKGSVFEVCLPALMPNNTF